MSPSLKSPLKLVLFSNLNENFSRKKQNFGSHWTQSFWSTKLQFGVPMTSVKKKCGSQYWSYVPSSLGLITEAQYSQPKTAIFNINRDLARKIDSFFSECVKSSVLVFLYRRSQCWCHPMKKCVERSKLSLSLSRDSQYMLSHFHP